MLKIMAFIMAALIGISIMVDNDTGDSEMWQNTSDRDFFMILEGENSTLYIRDGETLEGLRHEVWRLLLECVPPYNWKPEEI